MAKAPKPVASPNGSDAPGQSSGQTIQGVPPIVLPTRFAGKARALTPASPFEKGTSLRKTTEAKTNTSIAQTRAIRDSAALVRELGEANGLASTAITNLLALAAGSWRVSAYQTWSQEFSREGLVAAETILSSLETNWNYGTGYSDRRGLSLLTTSALLEVLLTGGVGLEVILDTYKVPRDFSLFPYDSVVWKSNGRGGRYPAQRITGAQEVELNYPTVFVGEIMLPANRSYARSIMAAGAQRLFQYESYIEDMWRVIRRAGEPRIVVKLSYENVVKSAPAEVRADETKLQTYLNTLREEVESLLRALEPDDALVIYDLAEIDSIQSNGEKKDFKELLSELSGLTASSMKSNASMLGMRLGGSQNVASTEAMLSTKVARMLQAPVEEIFSAALTLAVRLYGVDCYVQFRFDPINLRPDEELEAHRSLRQNRILELLSLGRITDDEAQLELGLGSLPAGAEVLSGTRFYDSKPADTAPVSGTNARNQSIMPEGPNSAGGKDNESRP